MSCGFVVATRMLQKYPNLVPKVDLLVSVVGFCHKDDFMFTRPRYYAYLWLSGFFKQKLPALFFKNVVLHPSVIRAFYAGTHNAKQKFKGLTPIDSKEALDFEVYLWRCNDVRTYMATTIHMLKLDNCTAQINMPVHHISVGIDQYFYSDIVEQHMRIVFSDFTKHAALSDRHAPSIIANKEAASKLMPQSIRVLLAKGTRV